MAKGKKINSYFLFFHQVIESLSKSIKLYISLLHFIYWCVKSYFFYLSDNLLLHFVSFLGLHVYKSK